MDINNGFVQVGDRRLAFTCLGSGSPAVVLEAGAGTPRTTWDRIMQRISEFTCVIGYDRAGTGESDPAPRRRSCRDFVSDLENVLEYNQISGPYILVGSSLGGHIVRYFASIHPGDVAGMVLIDSVHPEQNSQALALMPPPSPDESDIIQRMRIGLTVGYFDDPQKDPEGIDFFACDEEVRATGGLGDLPLVVITAGNRNGDGQPSDELSWYEQMFDRLQKDLTKLSSYGRQVIAERSGHYIHQDEPELVASVIQDMVTMARLRARGMELDKEARRAFDQQDYRYSRQLFQQSLDVCRLADWMEMIVYGLLHVTQIMSFEPEYSPENARPLLEEALRVALQIGSYWYIIPVQLNIIRLFQDEGNFTESFHLIKDIMSRIVEMNDPVLLNNLLTFSATALAGLRMSEPALRVFGSTEAERDRLGENLQEPFKSGLARRLSLARAELSKERQAIVEAEGYNLSLKDAVTYVLSIPLPE